MLVSGDLAMPAPKFIDDPAYRDLRENDIERGEAIGNEMLREVDVLRDEVDS